MEEAERRRQRWKKNLSLKAWFGDDEDEKEQEEGMKISMHGRLMVQPSRRVLKGPGIGDSIEEDDDEDGDEEEKKRAETQYRLTTVNKKKKVSFGARELRLECRM